jgi:tetratricopeptide (TPR) repeat protein
MHCWPRPVDNPREPVVRAARTNEFRRIAWPLSTNSGASPGQSRSFSKPSQPHGRESGADRTARLPTRSEAHSGVGLTLWQLGDYAGALRELRIAQELHRKRARRPNATTASLDELERLAALATRLPAVLEGEDHPRAAHECLALAALACKRGHFASAARLWAVALAADPEAARKATLMLAQRLRNEARPRSRARTPYRNRPCSSAHPDTRGNFGYDRH